MRVLVILLSAIGLVGPAGAQSVEEVDLAQKTLARLQEPSFRKRREHCGFIGYDDKGKLKATPAVEGTMDSCAAPYPTDLAVTASYHTHGAFDEGYYNELPSTIDVDGDAGAFLNGYVATPGGRFWIVSGRNRSAHLICGIGCLPVAPGFRKGLTGEILDGYSFEDLERALGY
ncbi:DUF4329 domain-containing protein [Salipiger sp. IMCC34102]|uniref:DUF4329 domain-containing protein n=1 Tax=Salipiger sp. IMCC34102 TaxID=2510647 RepID=UPI0013EC30DE|nr:DUF4329 domain-containing protein [Salipiger sp. IMCC34102]